MRERRRRSVGDILGRERGGGIGGGEGGKEEWWNISSVGGKRCTGSEKQGHGCAVECYSASGTSASRCSCQQVQLSAGAAVSRCICQQVQLSAGAAVIRARDTPHGLGGPTTCT